MCVFTTRAKTTNMDAKTKEYFRTELVGDYQEKSSSLKLHDIQSSNNNT